MPAPPCTRTYSVYVSLCVYACTYACARVSESVSRESVLRQTERGTEGRGQRACYCSLSWLEPLRSPSELLHACSDPDPLRPSRWVFSVTHASYHGLRDGLCVPRRGVFFSEGGVGCSREACTRADVTCGRPALQALGP
jgi:hypothetical protein